MKDSENDGGIMPGVDHYGGPIYVVSHVRRIFRTYPSTICSIAVYISLI